MSVVMVTPHAVLSRAQHELKVAYELLLDAKRHKQRIADVVMASQDRFILKIYHFFRTV